MKRRRGAFQDVAAATTGLIEAARAASVGCRIAPENTLARRFRDVAAAGCALKVKG
jgi:hypothetical protein